MGPSPEQRPSRNTPLPGRPADARGPTRNVRAVMTQRGSELVCSIVLPDRELAQAIPRRLHRTLRRPWRHRGPTHGRAASTSSQGMRPSRRSLGSTPVQSTTVDGPTPRTARRRARPPPCHRTSATSSAVAGVGPPWRLALVVGERPDRGAQRARHRWSGQRTPTVASSSPRSAARSGARG